MKMIFIISFFCLAITLHARNENIPSQIEDPECVTITKRNVSKVEETVKNIATKQKSDIPISALQRELMRLKNTITGLENSIQSCKDANPNYNFNTIDANVSKLIAEFEALQSNLLSDTVAAKKTWVDVNKYSIYILSFPTSHPPKLDMTANYIFSREEVEYYLGKESDDTKLRNELERFINLLNAESTKKAFLASINDMKEQVDKSTAISELNFLIRDVQHLKVVFSPKNSGFDEVILAANKMKTRLGG